MTVPVEVPIHKVEVFADPDSTYDMKLELNAEPALNVESLSHVPSEPVPTEET